MQSRITFSIVVLSIVFVSFCFGQQPGSTEEKADLAFPYIAEITADNVYIRSGPGTNYYPCGKLFKADKVTVVSTQFGWSRIVPTKANFSWISKQYVSIVPDQSNTGIVTGDNVRVYAGSAARDPIHSDTVQLKLSRDDKVTLLGEEKGGYQKIAPPTGAYLWVSSQYTNPIGPVSEVKAEVETDVKPQPEPPAQKPPVVTTKLPVEAESLKEYYALEKKIKAEQAKPMKQQNYTELKKALQKIADNKEAGKATRYASFAARQIERFELALSADKQVKLQNDQLSQILQKIEKVRNQKLEDLKDIGKFTVVGKFISSSIYAPRTEKRFFRIIDDAGKTTCYALPTAKAQNLGLQKFIGKKVGLMGTIQPHPQTSSVLLSFNEITKIE